MNAMQILIVDDSKVIRLMVAECVKQFGYTAIQAENGEQALEYFKNNPVDLILMDVEMPGMNGFAATKAIRACNENEWFPIIFLTNRTDDQSYEQCILAGGDAFLAKPISELQLRMQIVAMERIYLMRKKLKATQTELMKLNDALRYMSMYDQLTGLANRRYFDDSLKREFLLAQREKAPLSLLMCDLDDFKLYNDTYGHLAGDDCLSAAASAIASVSKRPTDLACRYGGEEFTVILPKTDLNEAKMIAEKIREILANRQIPHKASRVSEYVSLSLGVSTYRGQFKNCTELTNAADHALYLAKEHGRNRVETYLSNVSA